MTCMYLVLLYYIAQQEATSLAWAKTGIFEIFSSRAFKHQNMSTTRTNLFPSGTSAGPNHRCEPKATARSGKSTHSVGDKLVLVDYQLLSSDRPNWPHTLCKIIKNIIILDKFLDLCCVLSHNYHLLVVVSRIFNKKTRQLYPRLHLDSHCIS